LRYFLLLFIPLLLSANLTYISNHNKELSLLESFDIQPSFLYDPIMNKMKQRNSSLQTNKLFFQAMNDAYIFIPSIKKILAEYNIPQEFLYLAMAESNFKTKAYSNKSASGLWQFMSGTGRLYGLKIDQYVDERRDLIKSTKAASKYLSFLHKKFGKWYLAAIAYNCGGYRLQKAIEKAGSDELSVLLDPKKRYIPKESRFYIRKIIALALVGNDEQFLLKSEYEHLLNRANAYSVATVKISSGESLKRISEIINMPIDELKKLNRHLKYDFVPPYKKDYELYIPYIKLSEFKKNYKSEDIKNLYLVHVVKSGDNLWDIGRKYKVPYKIIMGFNNLKKNRLRLKQKLIIPIPKHIKSYDNGLFHVVQKGDSLDSISKEYKISIRTIKSYNNKTSDIIRIGERLKLYE
jgi:membrane-bound lytic murein transglycosylase D